MGGGKKHRLTRRHALRRCTPRPSAHFHLRYAAVKTSHTPETLAAMPLKLYFSRTSCAAWRMHGTFK